MVKPKKEESPIKGLILFLVVIIGLIAVAVYFHYTREEQSYSDVLFSLNAGSIEQIL